MIGESSIQDVERKKTTDEFLQFIEDPSMDDRKNLKIKDHNKDYNKDHNKSLESSSDMQTPLQNEDDNQNTSAMAVPSLPDTVPGPNSLL